MAGVPGYFPARTGLFLRFISPNPSEGDAACFYQMRGNVWECKLHPSGVEGYVYSIGAEFVVVAATVGSAWCLGEAATSDTSWPALYAMWVMYILVFPVMEWRSANCHCTDAWIGRIRRWQRWVVVSSAFCAAQAWVLGVGMVWSVATSAFTVAFIVTATRWRVPVLRMARRTRFYKPVQDYIDLWIDVLQHLVGLKRAADHDDHMDTGEALSRVQRNRRVVKKKKT